MPPEDLIGQSPVTAWWRSAHSRISEMDSGRLSNLPMGISLGRVQQPDSLARDNPKIKSLTEVINPYRSPPWRCLSELATVQEGDRDVVPSCLIHTKKLVKYMMRTVSTYGC
jgi:hypothetical protein